MDPSYLLSTGVCLIGLGTRTGYEMLKRAGTVGTKNKWIFALVLVAMLLFLGSWPIMTSKDIHLLDLPGPNQWLGTSQVIIGIGLAIGGLAQLRGLENIDHLVTTGIYAKIRHPMYSGFILWILGWVIYYGALTSLIVACVCISNILSWENFEEEEMRIQFGEDYMSYRKQTWF
jgi:protein-S-isoprenylcysteine O-methyltransferase Ste14